MLLLEIILKITGWGINDLARFLSVSEITINYWLKGNDISLYSKKLICQRFNLPISYFNIDLKNDFSRYELIYHNIEQIIKSNNIKINNQRNHILSELEIISCLAQGINPLTGKTFAKDHILNNECIKEALVKIKENYKYESNINSFDELTDEQKKLFNSLREWRLKKTQKEGFYKAFMILSDKQ